jgi:hypothetical protein
MFHMLTTWNMLGILLIKEAPTATGPPPNSIRRKPMFATFLFLVIFVALCLLFAEPKTATETTPEQPKATATAETMSPTPEPARIAARAAAMAPPMAKVTIPTEPATAATEIPTKAECMEAMTVSELRQLCTVNRVKWRNAHGKNRHLTKAEMIAALP